MERIDCVKYGVEMGSFWCILYYVFCDGEKICGPVNNG